MGIVNITRINLYTLVYGNLNDILQLLMGEGSQKRQQIPSPRIVLRIPYLTKSTSTVTMIPKLIRYSIMRYSTRTSALIWIPCFRKWPVHTSMTNWTMKPKYTLITKLGFSYERYINMKHINLHRRMHLPKLTTTGENLRCRNWHLFSDHEAKEMVLDKKAMEMEMVLAKTEKLCNVP